MDKLSKMFFSSFVLISIFLTGSVIAVGELNVRIDQKAITAFAGSSANVDVVIENNRNVGDTYSLTVFPQYWFGTSVSLSDTIVNLAPNSNQKIQLNFIIPQCAEERTTSFAVTARSITDDKILSSSSVTLSTVRQFYVCISDLRLSSDVISPGQTLSITTSVYNPTDSSSLPFTLETTIKNEEQQTVQTFTNNIETIGAKSTKTIQNTYTFSKYATAGNYFVDSFLKDNQGKEVSKSTAIFRISSVGNVTTERTINYGVLTETVMIRVKNEGNNPAFLYPVSESIPNFVRPFFFPKIEPSTEQTKGNMIVYTWILDTLNPGEEKVISYDVSVWNAWILIIVIGAAVYISFRYVFTLKLYKTHRHFGALTKEKEVPILLEVKNHSRNEIKDIIVRDFVPSIATVVERFDTLRPTLRKIPGGTELVWRLDFLRPGEERVITYRIKPSLEIMGTLKLPRAYMKFLDKKKELKKKVSKSVVIQSG